MGRVDKLVNLPLGAQCVLKAHDKGAQPVGVCDCQMCSDPKLVDTAGAILGRAGR
jgi:hypothetical protein